MLAKANPTAVRPQPARRRIKPISTQVAAPTRNQWSPVLGRKECAHIIPEAKLAASAAMGDVNRRDGLRRGIGRGDLPACGGVEVGSGVLLPKLVSSVVEGSAIFRGA
jgi:hypothetical protein